MLSCSDKSFYIGTTNDVGKRVQTHNDGKGAKYTRGRTPVKLIYSESHPDKSSALKREIQLKKWSKKRKQMLLNQ